VQVAVETGHLGVVALLKVEHRTFQHLRQDFSATHYQQRLLDAQRFDDTLLGAAGQPQLTLATTGGRRGGRGLHWRAVEQAFAGR